MSVSDDTLRAVINTYDKNSVWYRRDILGLRKQAQGLIYRQFADDTESFLIDNHTKCSIVFCTAGLDFGGNHSAHALNLTGFTRGFEKIITLDEWYSKDELTPCLLEEQVCNFMRKNLQLGYRIAGLYCDSAEQVLIRGIKAAFIRGNIPVNVFNARKSPIIDRIRFYSRIMNQGRYKIFKNCVHTIDAFASAVWDCGLPDDVRLDDGSCNIDSLDAQEYSTEAFMTQVIQAEIH